MIHKKWPLLGCGVGLRNLHYEFITREWPKVDWFEAVSENFMDSGGRPLRILEKVREHYPIVLHGTALSIGSSDPLDARYLTHLKALIERIEPAMVSDHLCWSGIDGERLHDLLPLPYTEEALAHVIRRVGELQEFLGRHVLLENVSTYLTYRHSTMPEWEFLAELARRSGCGILLDLNNLYVNAFNHGWDPLDYLEHLPSASIAQFHLAGHTDRGTFLFDTHSDRVIDPVWELYAKSLQCFGKVSTLIEWDEKIPEFSVLQSEARRARVDYDQALETASSPEQVVVPIADRSDAPRGAAPSLSDTQRWFKARVQPGAVYRPGRGPDIALHMQRETPGEERLAVYAEGYLARIHEALCEVYPAVRHLVGEGVFQRLADGYASAYPSQDYNLSMAGRHFSEFLRLRPEAQSFPFLPDLAELEWAVILSFHAFDEKPMNPDSLREISPEDWERAKLYFQASVRVLESRWPVLDLWEARRTPVQEIHIPLENRPQRVLLRREGAEVYCSLLEGFQFMVLSALLEGETLGSIFERLLEESQETLPPLQEWFGRWAAQGLFMRFEVAAEVKKAESPSR